MYETRNETAQTGPPVVRPAVRRELRVGDRMNLNRVAPGSLEPDGVSEADVRIEPLTNGTSHLRSSLPCVPSGEAR